MALCGFVVLEITLILVVGAHRSSLLPGSHVTFAHYVSGPLGGVAGSVVPSHEAALRTAFAVLLIGMCACYAVAAAAADRLPMTWVAGGAVAANLGILLAPIFPLTDVFNYLAYARIGVRHGLNPYVNPPSDAIHDPVYALVTWHRQPTPYGPLFTLLTYPLGLLGIPAALWILKTLVVAAALGCAALIAACAKRLGRSPQRAVVLVALNPLMLVYAVGGAHNDVFMLLAVLAGIYFVVSGRERLGAVGLAVAVGVKASALPVLPFLVLGAHQRRRALVAIVSGLAVLGVLTVAVFGTSAPGLTEQAAAMTPTSIPQLAAVVVGHGTPVYCKGAITCVNQGVLLASTLGLAVLLALVAWLAWRGTHWLTCAGWAAIAVVVTLTATMPWYLVWVLPFAVLSRSRALHLATAAVGGFLLVTAYPTAQVAATSYHKLIAPLFHG